MKKIWILLLLTSSLIATESKPWFSPPWELQGQLSYAFEHVHTIDTPNGNFTNTSYNSTVRGSLGVTPWPYWNVEVELLMSRARDIPFSYETFKGTIRYQWFDDITGNPVALATGITLSFPENRYQYNLSFVYPGDVNIELHATIGKELPCGRRWWMRGWALGGVGVANRGNGWLHGLAALEINPRFFELGIFTEALYGLGPNDIIPETFTGYGAIGYRNVDVGGYLKTSSLFGTMTYTGWYNIYAHNYPLDSWGFSINLFIPFSL